MKTIICVSLLLRITFLHIQFDLTESSSLPRQCTRVFCEEGTLCVVSRRGIPSCEPISSRPGVCPTEITNPECLRLRGAPQCLTDTDCPRKTKCCRACCQEATTQSQLDQVRFNDDLKPGRCPSQLEYVAVTWWTDLFCPDKGFIDSCQKDTECPGADKCCSGLCGKECTRIKFDAPRPEEVTPSLTTGVTTASTPAVTEFTTKPSTVLTTTPETVPSSKSTIESTTKRSTESTTESTTKPTTSESTTESTTKPTTSESTTESTTKPTISESKKESTTKPIISESTAESTTKTSNESTTELTTVDEKKTQIDFSNSTTELLNNSSASYNESSSHVGGVNKLENGLSEEGSIEQEFEQGNTGVVEKAVGLVAQTLSAHDSQRKNSAQNSTENTKTTATAKTTYTPEASEITTTSTTTTLQPTTTTTTEKPITAQANSRDNKKSVASRGSVHVYIATEG